MNPAHATPRRGIMIHLQNVTLQRGNVEVLHDISLELAQGTVTALVGRRA